MNKQELINKKCKVAIDRFKKNGNINDMQWRFNNGKGVTSGCWHNCSETCNHNKTLKDFIAECKLIKHVVEFRIKPKAKKVIRKCGICKLLVDIDDDRAVVNQLLPGNPYCHRLCWENRKVIEEFVKHGRDNIQVWSNGWKLMTATKSLDELLEWMTRHSFRVKPEEEKKDEYDIHALSDFNKAMMTGTIDPHEIIKTFIEQINEHKRAITEIKSKLAELIEHI